MEPTPTTPVGFDRSLQIQYEDNTTFQCHILNLLPSTIATSSDTTTASPTTLLLLIHGAGCTSSSWCLLTQELRAIHSETANQPHIVVAAYDMRGHGQTKSTNEKDEKDLSLDRLVQDAIIVLQGLTKALEITQIILVGHSLGGAIVVRAAASESINFPIVGVVVVDLVEGTALASLPHLPDLLHTRPDYFPNVQEAIKWSLDARMVNNPSSALLSVPSMLVQIEKEPNESESNPSTTTTTTSTTSTTTAATAYTWRTNLHETSLYWDEWYRGLSKDFLSINSNKLLILASTDRLDKTLMIGQMQGKFQFQVVKSAGHSVHEDQPQHVAVLLYKFLLRITGGVTKVSILSSSFDQKSLFAKKN
jgi:protein phosphatase methylesterase 1